MEYGEAINAESSKRTLEVALELKVARPAAPLEEIAREAVARSYCTCVTDGEDLAEHRFSDVHRRLIEEVRAMLLESPDQRETFSPVASQPPAARRQCFGGASDDLSTMR